MKVPYDKYSNTSVNKCTYVLCLLPSKQPIDLSLLLILIKQQQRSNRFTFSSNSTNVTAFHDLPRNQPSSYATPPTPSPITSLQQRNTRVRREYSRLRKRLRKPKGANRSTLEESRGHENHDGFERDAVKCIPWTFLQSTFPASSAGGILSKWRWIAFIRVTPCAAHSHSPAFSFPHPPFSLPPLDIPFLLFFFFFPPFPLSHALSTPSLPFCVLHSLTLLGPSTPQSTATVIIGDPRFTKFLRMTEIRN